VAKALAGGTARQQIRPTSTAQLSKASNDTLLNLSYLEGTIGYSIRRAQLAIFRDIYRAFDEISVTTAQFSILAVVGDNPGVNQADLALALGVERPRIVPLIDSLEARGLATRTAGVADRRQRNIRLTSKGTKVLADLKQRFAKHQKRLIDALGASEANALLMTLQRVPSLLSAEDEQSDA
jgi:DNA-binding MarR family transcriptional regulator